MTGTAICNVAALCTTQTKVSCVFLSHIFLLMAFYFQRQLIFPDLGNTIYSGHVVPCFDIRVISEGQCVKPDPPKCSRRGTVKNPYFFDYFNCVGKR
jgi:hypothetical protein